MTSSEKKTVKKSNPPERTEIKVMGCATTSRQATMANVSPPSDLANRYATSTNAGNTIRLK